MGAKQHSLSQSCQGLSNQAAILNELASNKPCKNRILTLPVGKGPFKKGPQIWAKNNVYTRLALNI